MTRTQSLTFIFVLLSAGCGGAAGDSGRHAEVAPLAPATPRLASATNTASTPSKPFECTVILGLAVTEEWFSAGFEQAVGDEHWQAILRPHTFVEQWANSEDLVWSQAPTSPCKLRAENPDRVVFFAADWKYGDESEWISGLTAAVKAIRVKYPEVRSVELLPMLRGPNNASCGDPKSVVAPFIDQAMDKVSAQLASIVRRGPRFEVSSCAAFEKGGPHFTAEGRVEVAKMIAAHYSSTPLP